jgi:hypothetical protein
MKLIHVRNPECRHDFDYLVADIRFIYTLEGLGHPIIEAIEYIFLESLKAYSTKFTLSSLDEIRSRCLESLELHQKLSRRRLINSRW